VQNKSAPSRGRPAFRLENAYLAAQVAAGIALLLAGIGSGSSGDCRGIWNNFGSDELLDFVPIVCSREWTVESCANHWLPGAKVIVLGTGLDGLR
jgi:hypothetical protein